VLLQQVEPENRNGRSDAAATPPAETSIVNGFTPSVCLKIICVAYVKLILARAWRPWNRRGRAPNRESGPVRPALPRCAAKLQKRRIFCLPSASACFGGIFQKFTTRAAPTLKPLLLDLPSTRHIQEGLDPNKISGVGTNFGHLVRVLPGLNKRSLCKQKK